MNVKAVLLRLGFCPFLWGCVYLYKAIQGELTKTSSQKEYSFYIPNEYLYYCQLHCALAVLHIGIICSKLPLHHMGITYYEQECWISGIKSKCEMRSRMWSLS